jgi:hypothetical protein
MSNDQDIAAALRAEADQRQAGLSGMADCLATFYLRLRHHKIPTTHALELTNTLLIESLAETE